MSLVWAKFYLECAKVIIWPLLLIILLLIFKTKITKWLENRDVSVKAAGIELLLSKVETEKLTPSQRKELANLTASDIWSLVSFRDSPTNRNIRAMNTTLKVSAVTLIDAGVLVRNGNEVEITSFGKEVLEKAEKILD